MYGQDLFSFVTLPKFGCKLGCAFFSTVMASKPA